MREEGENNQVRRKNKQLMSRDQHKSKVHRKEEEVIQMIGGNHNLIWMILIINLKWKCKKNKSYKNKNK